MKFKLKTKIYNKNKIIVTDGMIGGGKTLIANLISGLKSVEPWIHDTNLERICALNSLKKISIDSSTDLIKKSFNEKYFDTYILRYSNFRKNDISSLVNHLRYKSIRKRQKITNIEAEKKIKKIKMGVQFMTHMNTPHSEPIFRAFRKKLFYVIILRNPFSIYTLNWLARWTELFKKFDHRDGRVNFYSTKHKINFPFEVKKRDVDYYFRLNKFEKAFYLTENYYYESLKKINLLSNKYESKFMIIPFEKLTTNPFKYLKKISKILNIKIDKVTIKIVKKNKVPRIHSESLGRIINYDFSKNLFPAKYRKYFRSKITDEKLEELKHSYFKKNLNNKLFQRLLKLEKFYKKKILNRY